jgi:hypothetical protein
MATGQLIPKWRHPSETTFIFDNTVVQDTEYLNTEMVSFITVFSSSKGIDNKLLKKESLYSFVEEYGYPDFRFYDLQSYIPYTALSTGNATCWTMRVMPDDATYGNVFYTVEYRVVQKEVRLNDTIDPNTGTYAYPAEMINVLQVAFVPEFSEEITDAQLFEEVLNTQEGFDEETGTYKYGTIRRTPRNENGGDTFLKRPLIGFRMLGRGKYGDNFRVRLSHDTSSDKENEYKNYTLAVLNTESGIVQKETFPAITFDEDAIDPKTYVTSYIEDIVNDYEGDGSKRIAVQFFPDFHKEIFEFYKENVDPDTEFTNETFDIFGYDRLNATDNRRIQIVRIDPETRAVYESDIRSVALFDVKGVKLAGGSDGSFDKDNLKTASNRTAELDLMYRRAFDLSEPLDKKILSTLRSPANVILDAGYSVNIKPLIAALVNKRRDVIGYLDSGTSSTVENAKTILKNLELDDYLYSLNMGCFTTRDSVTGKKVKVPITIWLAHKIPLHWAQKGLQTPLAGEEYATLTGYIKNSIEPEIDADDYETKEDLYDNRINYIECIGENTYIRGTQQTSQTELSDLSEENNVHVMLQVKRRLERLCAQKRYHFGEASDRKMYTDDAQEIFSTWKGVYLRSIDIEFSMTRYEELRSILHCTCSIVFMTIVKRSIIEININPRA